MCVGVKSLVWLVGAWRRLYRKLGCRLFHHPDVIKKFNSAGCSAIQRHTALYELGALPPNVATGVGQRTPGVLAVYEIPFIQKHDFSFSESFSIGSKQQYLRYRVGQHTTKKAKLFRAGLWLVVADAQRLVARNLGLSFPRSKPIMDFAVGIAAYPACRFGLGVVARYRRGLSFQSSGPGWIRTSVSPVSDQALSPVKLRGHKNHSVTFLSVL
jgi:hypothetical protein